MAMAAPGCCNKKRSGGDAGVGDPSLAQEPSSSTRGEEEEPHPPLLSSPLTLLHLEKKGKQMDPTGNDDRLPQAMAAGSPPSGGLSVRPLPSPASTSPLHPASNEMEEAFLRWIQPTNFHWVGGGSRPRKGDARTRGEAERVRPTRGCGPQGGARAGEAGARGPARKADEVIGAQRARPAG
uniref:Uncharacterized protein n=1 Tax=Oryza punctata TaxID=4537 RepID=A0A0E0LEU6_ORYPU